MLQAGRQASEKLGKVPSATVRTKGPDLRPLTVLVPLGLMVIRLPIGKGLGMGSLRLCPSDWKISDRVNPLQFLPHGGLPHEQGQQGITLHQEPCQGRGAARHQIVQIFHQMMDFLFTDTITHSRSLRVA